MTPKTLLPVLGIFVCCFTSSFAQDTAIKHKIGSAVTVVFPGIPDTLSDRGVDGMYLNTEAISYVAVINRSEAMKGINTKREFKRALENAVDGYRRAKNLQGFSHQTTDTVIGGSEGQLLHLYNRPDDELREEVLAFLTIQDDQFYAIQVVVRNSYEPDRASIYEFFNNVEFHGKNYRSNSSSAYDIGYKMGYYFVPVMLLVLLIVFIVRRTNNKNRRDRNRHLTGSL